MLGAKEAEGRMMEDGHMGARETWELGYRPGSWMDGSELQVGLTPQYSRGFSPSPFLQASSCQNFLAEQKVP